MPDGLLKSMGLGTMAVALGVSYGMKVPEHSFFNELRSLYPFWVGLSSCYYWVSYRMKSCFILIVLYYSGVGNKMKAFKINDLGEGKGVLLQYSVFLGKSARESKRARKHRFTGVCIHGRMDE
jgi:hypothetical protein